ncbi:aldose epimerase family protein [Evansella tamaricis]|uniref:Aldose 1-epimerase n=1 Tax=Evansella tamaricis TaxID=2069301 RepID=A0ABS6JNC7_9BACI|nr:aldose epimerase family protein [Evansella tamaricis]MBU9713813.1 galactose mutarotase [Evansella tamaricis]
MKITQSNFGELNGKEVIAYTLKNNKSFEMTCLNYGCIITELYVPDMDGKVENIVLGFNNVEDYINHSPYFGATVGRVAGRINKGEFSLEGRKYQLPINDGNNHLHGGIEGFDKVFWDVEPFENEDQIGLVFSYLSQDGEEGYPGNVNVKITYTVNTKNELTIEYEGKTDQKTLLNLTNHTYFNLSGGLKRDILDHELTMKSSGFLSLTKELIPTGEVESVSNTPFDFRKGRKVKDGVTSDHDQNILVGNGYDHPFILDENNNGEILLKDDDSGRSILVETSEPCVVFYTGNMLNNNFKLGEIQSKKYLGLCLETQKHPDAVNHPHFDSITLSPGEIYKTKTKYSFQVSN